MQISQIKPDVIVWGDVFPEKVRIIKFNQAGDFMKLTASGCESQQTYDRILNIDHIQQLQCTQIDDEYQGNSSLFKLGIESIRIGFAYEYDPYFALSLARIDPLPHQLEAVYDYFLKMPRVRFLLADDPGAGKTIMAGLLLKELKVRGLVKRTLIITPANLSFQWQRELKEKFREQFEIMNSEILRVNYGINPWHDKNQVITSISWVSRIEDAKMSLLNSHWDLIIVDEAHKMSALSSDKKTLAYKLGEKLSEKTDHYLLMTATPHKGNPQAFCLFLELLDRDVYADVKSLDEAMAKQSAPFYLRRIKEALVTFPDPKTNKPKHIFTKRKVNTVEFNINETELELYDLLTDFVEEQSVKANQDKRPEARALGFTMAMLQRRFASSLYAVRRTLERMRDNRQKILDDPKLYRQDKINRKLPEDFDELSEEEQTEILDELENIVISIDTVTLKKDIAALNKLIDKANVTEKRGIESKLVRLKELLTSEKIFGDPKMKLLIFTEHKDTLDYLVGDGKEDRPLGKLREWGINVAQIHGGMKIGDRDTPGTRIYAEREFRENAQVLVATEAAGEGINLQFCWLMVNYDIPWNPVRLEQRMGRIHRYGQTKECLIYNFVSVNTREGRVLQTLFKRIQQIEADIDPGRTGKVFNVLGDIFPSNKLEQCVRDMYAKNETEITLTKFIEGEVDLERFRKITKSALEGLVKRELNLSALSGKYAEAKERRLIPETIESFFNNAAVETGMVFKEIKSHCYRAEKLPSKLRSIGEKLEQRYGKLGSEYKQIVFDRQLLEKDARSEWVTPGHPLFEVVRQYIENESKVSMEQGTVLFDLDTDTPYHLDVFIAAINDGLGKTLHKRLLIVKTDLNGNHYIKEPTLFLDLSAGTDKVTKCDLPTTPDKAETELFAIENLQTTLADVTKERKRQVEVISKHLNLSLNELIMQQQQTVARLYENENDPRFNANMKVIEDRLLELNHRLETRQRELKQEEQCMLGNIELIGRAWVLPSPQRNNPELAPLVKDDEIERIAVEAAIAFEEARGWTVESVEEQNRGFDLISRNTQNIEQFRYIEVKGRAETGSILLSQNEYQTAHLLQDNYWLYVVYYCNSAPKVQTICNPAKLNWEPIIKVDHYVIKDCQLPIDDR
ncbi:MAG: DUF3883 domain-containing protein [Planctomycetaceae bacterium]|jgi:superfamily II DNA or RNA helicase|nr:DUF3883 domain-containing protein [Planctomycetaceae bacterium]